jgi:L-lactate dehydrogenase complex protein LldG
VRSNASSRSSILKALRRRPSATATLVDYDNPPCRFTDRRQEFVAAVAAVAGVCTPVADAAELERRLEDIPAYAGARHIVSAVPGAGLRANVVETSVCDPHELANLDFALVPGDFGVAENGAVWVSGGGLRHRAVYFVAQHLALALPAKALVDDMHQAYERLCFDAPSFGTFLAGPSKTADIEQALVIGAHGARTLTVFLVG